MAHKDEGVEEISRLVQDVEAKQVSSSPKPHVGSIQPAVEEPWLSEVMDVLDYAKGQEQLVTTINSTPLPIGMKPEPIDLFQGPSKCSCCVSWVKEQPDDLKEILKETDEVKQHVVLVRRKHSHQIYSHEPLEIDSIVVNSPLIRVALEEIFSDCPEIDMEAQSWTFQAPFELLFHYWDELNEFLEPENSDTSLHVKVLYNVLLPVLEEPLSLSKTLNSHGLISFELIWTLFKPGRTIYCRRTAEDEADCLFVLESSGYKEREKQTEPDYSLTGTRVDWDGKQFGRTRFSLDIGHFDGPKHITELPAYPLEDGEHKKAVESRLLERGYRFEQLAGIKYVAYRGIAHRLSKRQGSTYMSSEAKVLVSLIRSHCRLLSRENA